MSSIWNGMKKVGNSVISVGKTVKTTLSVGRAGVVFYAMYISMGLNPYTVVIPITLALL